MIYYEDHSSACCTIPNTKPHKTFEDAKRYCNIDKECKYFFDIDCDEKDFFTCHKGSLTRNAQKDDVVCIYAKGSLNFQLKDVIKCYNISISYFK